MKNKLQKNIRLFPLYALVLMLLGCSGEDDNNDEDPPAEIEMFLLTVNGGSGSERYAQGSEVSISANNAPSGKTFGRWVIAEGSPNIADINSANTTLTMPATAVILEAAYQDDEQQEPEAPDGFTWCANEGSSCTFSETVDIAYGANGVFNYKYGVTGTISFNNSAFGDPIPGVRKAGFYRLANIDTSDIRSALAHILDHLNCNNDNCKLTKVQLADYYIQFILALRSNSFPVNDESVRWRYLEKTERFLQSYGYFPERIISSSEDVTLIKNIINAFNNSGRQSLIETHRTLFDDPLQQSDKNIERIIFLLEQVFFDHVYDPENLPRWISLLNNFSLGAHKFYPGSPNLSKATEFHRAPGSVVIDASSKTQWGYNIAFHNDSKKRPTGFYAIPGKQFEVIVPSIMVDAGFEIMVNAHDIDLARHKNLKRQNRISHSYPIDSTKITLQSAVGGGIYIKVPNNVDLELQTVSVSGALKAPYFRKLEHAQTNEAQWNQMRQSPALWADFESQYFMMTIPAKWTEALSHDEITNVLNQWDRMMSSVISLLGYCELPTGSCEKLNSVALYQIVDARIKHGAYGIGYPQSNFTYDVSMTNQPDSAGRGAKQYFLNDPISQAGSFSIEYHEMGHARIKQLFNGETESIVNIISVYIAHTLYGKTLDESLPYAMNTAPLTSLENVAKEWMARTNFRNDNPMNITNSTKNEVRYQAKGLGRYIEIVRLAEESLGKNNAWDFLKQYYRDIHLAVENGANTRCAAFGDTRFPDKESYQPKQSQDCELFMLSKSIGFNVVPLLHFWGVHPGDYSIIKAELSRQGIQEDNRVCLRIRHYKDQVTKSGDEFDQLYQALWPNHYRQFVESQSNADPGHPDYAGGWFFTERNNYTSETAQAARDAIDRVLSTYYPQGCNG